MRNTQSVDVNVDFGDFYFPHSPSATQKGDRNGEIAFQLKSLYVAAKQKENSNYTAASFVLIFRLPRFLNNVNFEHFNAYGFFKIDSFSGFYILVFISFD